MKIITDTTEIRLERETAAAIGKVDGIHIGQDFWRRSCQGNPKAGLPVFLRLIRRRRYFSAALTEKS